MLDKYDFRCPKCREILNKAQNIVLTSIRKNGDVGRIYLSTSVGDYSYIHEPPDQFEDGELVTFCCTECGTHLNSDQFENYTQIIMSVNNSVEFDILFSREAGVQKTYLITEDGVETYVGT